MATVVGRYMTPEAAERVAQAFRDALYADPYNYRTEYSRNIETPDPVVADIDVRVESDRADHNLMTAKGILLAQAAWHQRPRRARQADHRGRLKNSRKGNDDGDAKRPAHEWRSTSAPPGATWG